MTVKFNPLHVFARKQTVGKDDAEAVALPVMVYLDAAKRGECPHAGANHLALHLIMASYIAQQKKARPFYDQVMAAYYALKKASERPTELLDLTTGEHRAISKALRTYLSSLPSMEIGLLSDAQMVAQMKLTSTEGE
jgi:hypothetical protein